MMKCTCNKEIYRLCSTELCPHPSQFCDNKFCPTYLKHIRCNTIVAQPLLAIDKQIEKSEKEFIVKANVLLNELVQDIKFKHTQRFSRKRHLKLGKLIKKLKKGRNGSRDSYITGKEVKEANEEIYNLGPEQSQQHSQRCLKEFTSIIEGLRNKIIDETERYFGGNMEEQLHSNTQQLQQEVPLNEQSPPQRPPITQISRSPFNFQKVQRKIPKSQAQTAQCLSGSSKDFISESFHPRKVRSINKIYTASALENNYSPSAFYAKCGNLPNTLIVVSYKYRFQPSHEHNFFAGFTPLPWDHQSYKDRTHQADPSLMSRIFWLDERMVFPLKKQEAQKAILIDKNFGLLFGNDLLIKFNKDGMDVNTMTIGTRYETGHLSEESRGKLKDYQKKIRQGMGRVRNYQVYQIQFEE